MKNRLEFLDNLGSPAVVTDNSGNVQKQYRYYAFGNLRSQSGSFNTDYSFTGYLKEETGNHYAKMRYYEGGIGRFLRVDPLGALNPYVYCGNDPLNFVDPEGLMFSYGYSTRYINAYITAGIKNNLDYFQLRFSQYRQKLGEYIDKSLFNRPPGQQWTVQEAIATALYTLIVPVAGCWILHENEDGTFDTF